MRNRSTNQGYVQKQKTMNLLNNGPHPMRSSKKSVWPEWGTSELKSSAVLPEQCAEEVKEKVLNSKMEKTNFCRRNMCRIAAKNSSKICTSWETWIKLSTRRRLENVSVTKEEFSPYGSIFCQGVENLENGRGGKVKTPKSWTGQKNERVSCGEGCTQDKIIPLITMWQFLQLFTAWISRSGAGAAPFAEMVGPYGASLPRWLSVGRIVPSTFNISLVGSSTLDFSLVGSSRHHLVDWIVNVGSCRQHWAVSLMICWTVLLKFS